jgi:translation initiation factor IF-1
MTRAAGASGTPPTIGLAGTVLEVLPRALYRVAVEGGREIKAHVAAGPRRNFVRLIVGDRVLVQLTAKDVGRGRIVRRAT